MSPQRFQKPLPRSFYNRSADIVASELLGCLLCRTLGDQALVGRIVETEAYLGIQDRACHASRGQTQRNTAMFGPPGHAYVYFVYGMHFMFNVVCQPEGDPHAVLIRALEPLKGMETMSELRQQTSTLRLTNGPANLCRALKINRDLNGVDLLQSDVWIGHGGLRSDETINSSARVGVDYAGPDAVLPLRFFVGSSKFLSKGKPSTGRPAISES